MVVNHITPQPLRWSPLVSQSGALSGRLGRRKFAASLGPHQRCRKTGASQRARRPRQRQCLLKGCEKHFRPTHPQARYCSPECRAEARRWRRRRASRAVSADCQRSGKTPGSEPASTGLVGPNACGQRQPKPVLSSTPDTACRVCGAAARGPAPSNGIRIFLLRSSRL